MKKLLLIAFTACLPIFLMAQNIENKLGTGGSFLIQDENTNNLFNMYSLGGQPTMLIGGADGFGDRREVNLLKEGGSAGITITSYEGLFRTVSQLDMFRANGTIAAKEAVELDDGIGEFNFLGHDGSAFHNGATIIGLVDGTVNTDVIPVRLEFRTTAVDGSSGSRLTIKNDGKIGVNTTDPNSTFSVNGSVSTSVVLPAGDYPVTSDDYMIYAEGSSSTITLPEATAGIYGRTYVIKAKIDVQAAVTVIATNVPIEGGSSVSLDAGESITVQSIGTAWYIIASHGSPTVNP